MKKTLSIIAVSAIAALGLQAQDYRIGDASEKGGISASMMQELHDSYKETASDKAIRNALNSTPIGVLAASADKIAMIDTHFTDEVRTKGRTNQLSSGRCWLFTGLNVMRAKMIDKYNLGDFTFSQNYCFFYDQLEKSNLFLQGIIDTAELPIDDQKVTFLFKNPLSDGGTFTGVANLVTKYGLVPSSVMPETYSANNTSAWTRQVATKLREDGLRLREAKAAGKKAKELQAMKMEQLKEIYHMLALCLGVPPTEFTYAMYDAKDNLISEKTYTPLSFYKEYVDADLNNNYIMLMNDPMREYGKVYEIEYDRHLYDGQNWLYLNLPVDRIKEIAIASIKDNTAMYFSCDVGKCSDRKRGVADLDLYDYESIFGVKFGMNKKERVSTFASGSSHAMTLIAVDIKDGKPVKWMVENSWGRESGYKGNIIMTDEWFNEYMFRLVVEKKYCPEDILKMMEQKPVLLPAWDPMFSEEN